jgi:hypothetical protein
MLRERSKQRWMGAAIVVISSMWIIVGVPLLSKSKWLREAAFVWSLGGEIFCDCAN